MINAARVGTPSGCEDLYEAKPCPPLAVHAAVKGDSGCCREFRLRVSRRKFFGYRALPLRNHHETFLLLLSFQPTDVWFQQPGDLLVHAT